MKQIKNENELKKSLVSSIEKREKAKKERRTVLAQTVYLGTIGVMFILPVIVRRLCWGLAR